MFRRELPCGIRFRFGYIGMSQLLYIWIECDFFMMMMLTDRTLAYLREESPWITSAKYSFVKNRRSIVGKISAPKRKSDIKMNL